MTVVLPSCHTHRGFRVPSRIIVMLDVRCNGSETYDGGGDISEFVSCMRRQRTRSGPPLKQWTFRAQFVNGQRELSVTFPSVCDVAAQSIAK